MSSCLPKGKVEKRSGVREERNRNSSKNNYNFWRNCLAVECDSRATAQLAAINRISVHKIRVAIYSVNSFVFDSSNKDNQDFIR